MKLTELHALLEENGYVPQFKTIEKTIEIEGKQKTIKIDRIYLNESSKSCQLYFEGSNPFLYVFLKQAKGFDFKTYKQSDEDKQKCRKAKFELLNLLKEDGFKGIEEYASAEETLLFPKRPEPKKKLSI